MENKYLFVCYANKNRSIVGEQVFKEMLTERGFRVSGPENLLEWDYSVSSAGIKPEDKSKEFSVSMAEGVINIFVADEYIKRLLKSEFNFEDDLRMVNLGIPDLYDITIDGKRRVLEEYMRVKLFPHLPRRQYFP